MVMVLEPPTTLHPLPSVSRNLVSTCALVFQQGQSAQGEAQTPHQVGPVASQTRPLPHGKQVASDLRNNDKTGIALLTWSWNLHDDDHQHPNF